MPTIFFSTEDLAGSAIAMSLVYDLKFEEKPELVKEGQKYKQWFGPGGIGLVELRGRLVEADYLERLFPPSDLWVFASRHSSEAGLPALTVHASGNWGSKAEAGGKPGELCMTSARALKSAFKFFEQNKPEGYQVSLEVNHHGPTSFTTPTVWVELGSSEPQWKDKNAAAVVARAILNCCQNYEAEAGKVAIGFGGTHYAPKFNPLESKDLAFSHIAPKHCLGEVTPEMVKQAIAKTQEKVELALIDWKGCTREQKDKVIPAIEAAGLPWERA